MKKERKEKLAKEAERIKREAHEEQERNEQMERKRKENEWAVRMEKLETEKKGNCVIERGSSGFRNRGSQGRAPATYPAMVSRGRFSHR